MFTEEEKKYVYSRSHVEKIKNSTVSWNKNHYPVMWHDSSNIQINGHCTLSDWFIRKPITDSVVPFVLYFFLIRWENGLILYMSDC